MGPMPFGRQPIPIMAAGAGGGGGGGGGGFGGGGRGTPGAKGAQGNQGPGSGGGGGNAFIATESYIGDGTVGRVITTGLTGSLKSLSIVAENLGELVKTDFMAGASFFFTAGGSITNGITISGADFVVDFDSGFSAANDPGVTYYWTAFATP